MGDIGTDGQEINAKLFKIYVGSSSNEWKFLQNARINISHPIFREPTTSGGVLTFTGATDNTITGSFIFSRDEWTTSIVAGVTNTSGFRDLLVQSTTTGEVPEKSWIVKFTDVSAVSTGTTLTFTRCKLSTTEISKSTEGGVKVDVTIVCPVEPSSG